MSGGLVARGETEEDGIAGVDAAEAVDGHVLDDSPVDTGNGDGAAVGVVDEDVAETEVSERTPCDGAKLDAVGTAAPDAVLNQYVFRHALRAMAFETVGIVGGIDVAVSHHHIAAVDNVQAVIVPITFGVDIDAFDKEVFALVILLAPGGRVDVWWPCCARRDGGRWDCRC